MRISRRRFLGESVCVAGGLIAAPSLAGLAGGTRSKAFFEWTRVREGVIATQGLEYGGNSMVVIGEGGALLVDSKFPALGPILRAEAAHQGGEVSVLVNTHHHADHTGGNLAFKQNARIMAHANAYPRIDEQVARYRQMIRSAPSQVFPQMEGTDHDDLMPELEKMMAQAHLLGGDRWIPDERIPDGESEIEVGGVRVLLRHVGAGHTDNDVFVYLPEQNVLHTGDLVFHRLNPYIDRPAGATTLGWMDSCRAMLGVCDADTVVIPGHGDVTDRTGIEGQIEYFERVREFVRARMDEGASVAQVRANPPQWMQELGFGRMTAMVLGEVYAELRAESDG